MPTLLLEHAPALFDEGFEHDPRRGLGGVVDSGLTDAHGRLTLDEILSSAWEGLAVRGAVTCPVCAGPMAASVKVHARAGGHAEDRAGAHGRGRDELSGVCLGCGSRLA